MSGTLVPPTAPRPHDDDCDCLTCVRQNKAEAKRQEMLQEIARRSGNEKQGRGKWGRRK